MVVRDPAKRLALAEPIVAGGAEYFALMRPQKDATDEGHAAWARGHAENLTSTSRHVPAFVVGLLVRRGYPRRSRAATRTISSRCRSPSRT